MRASFSHHQLELGTPKVTTRSELGSELRGVGLTILFSHPLAAVLQLAQVPGDQAKQDILHAIAARVKAGAPLILAGNHFRYASQALLLAAWGERWRMQSASADEVKAKDFAESRSAPFRGSGDRSARKCRIRKATTILVQFVLGRLDCV